MQPRRFNLWEMRSCRNLCGLALWFLLVSGLTGVPRAEAEDGDRSGLYAEQTKGGANPTNDLGSWIWSDMVFDRQTCQLWRDFEIPSGVEVVRATLYMTADNEHSLFLDGRPIGRGAEWRNLCQYDLKKLLPAGHHVLAITAFNSANFAGVILGLSVELADGTTIKVKSDETWRIIPEGVKGGEKLTEARSTWPFATVVGRLGAKPWWKNPENIEIIPPMESVEIAFWQKGWFQFTLMAVCGIVILISLSLTAQLALHQKERLLLQQERARIARDIHDDLGSRMTQLVLHGEVAQSELSVDSETRHQLHRMCEEARGLLSSVDEILWAVNPRRDTLRDFAAYVCDYAQEFFKPTSIQCLFDVNPEMPSASFDLPLRRSLLMAIKETLNNVAKHSGASEVLLQIRWEGQRLIVVVQDDGHGFDPGKSRNNRHGLSNLSQRMQEVGGKCSIQSQPGKGCRVEFDVPLSHLRPRMWDYLWKSRPVILNGREAHPVHLPAPAPLHDPTHTL